MTMLSSKSNEEIKRMLDDYGIKHGPVVDSTRALYEKKLREAMSKHRRTQVQSDRTYYREEEDVTYVQHHRPQQVSQPEYLSSYGKTVKLTSFFWFIRTWSDYRGMDYTDEPAIYRTQAPYQNMSQARNLPPEPHIQKTPEKTRLVPVWLQILVFLIVSGLLYLVYINTESAEPEKRLT
uniref:Emerin-like n=1 Tax=Sinocyclocheilus grahami TaxID=75366 RepID=A0A672L683_SINGR